MKNRLCCKDINCIIEGQLVSNYDGDFTFRDVFVCMKCMRIFVRDYGAQPNFKELYRGDDEFERYLFYTY